MRTVVVVVVCMAVVVVLCKGSYWLGRKREEYKHTVWLINTHNRITAGFEIFKAHLDSKDITIEEMLREFELTLLDFLDALNRPYTDESLSEQETSNERQN